MTQEPLTQAAPVLLLNTLPGPALARLDAAFELHRLDLDAGEADLPDAIARRIRGVAAGLGAPVDAGLMARLPGLEIVAKFGVGYDAVDVGAAARRGITVTNTPDVLTDEVADLAVGLLLAVVRQIPRAERHLRAGRWPAGPYPLTPTLRGRRAGILGLGRIGRAIADRLAAFGVEIAYHGRRPQAGVPHAYHASLVGMARHVDVLMVVAPGTPETRGLVDAAVLAALGPAGILVNVARGSLVDEPALIRALEEGVILGAGLDVFADEPHVPERLIACENAVLLPHVGSGSEHTRAAMGGLVVDNLVGWFSGRGPLTPVAETPWSPPA